MMSASNPWVACPYCESTQTRKVSASMVKVVFVCDTCGRDFGIRQERFTTTVSLERRKELSQLGTTPEAFIGDIVSKVVADWNKRS